MAGEEQGQQQGGQQGQQQNGQQQGGGQQQQQQAPAWHTGLDAEVLGHAQNNGWLIDDPKAAFAKAVTSHKEAQRYIGAPPSEVLRLPKPSAPPAEIDAFWQRLGMPKEAKEYDLSGVKFAGADLEQGFVDTLRGAFHGVRLPKEAAAPIAQAVTKWLEDQDKAEETLRQGRLAEQVGNLKKNWGGNYDVNMTVAKLAFTKAAQAAGLDEAKAKEAVDAISTLGGVGGATVMEMFLALGSRMGEGRFVTTSRPGGGDMPMTRESAKDEIDGLKKDKAFRDKLLAGDVASKQRWTALHKMAYGEAA